MSWSVSTARLRRTPPVPLLLRLMAVAAAAPHLARMGLPRLQRVLEPRTTPAPTRRVDGAAVDGAAVDGAAVDGAEVGAVVLDEYGRWVDAIIRRGHPLVRPGCLTRGITLYYGLRRAGLDVSLCFGMGGDDDGPVGHCWIDIDGSPQLEPVEPTSKFTSVARLSRAGVTG